MSKIKCILLFVAVAGLQLSALSQGSSTNSPYSRYGYGMLADQSSSAGHAMGGLGYGLRNSSQINPMNPASYSAVDSLTFLFDMGVDFQISWMKESYGGKLNKQKDYNGNIKNINMLFPVGKGFAVSAGIMPDTYVGYNYTQQDTYGYTSYYGSGGFHEVYGGLAYKYDNFSIGANIGYLFGDIEHYVYTTPVSSSGIYQDSIRIRAHDLIYTLGLQQTIPLNNHKQLILGAAYTPKLKMTARGTESQYIGSTVIKDTISSGNEFDMAQKLGVGLSLMSGDQWTIGADVLWENWADAKLNGVTDTLNNRLRYAAGFEYTPNSRSRNFFSRVKYRAGGYYSNSYITTDAGSKYDEYGMSLGLGLPVNKSVIHVSFDYVHVKPTIANMLTENYFKITLNYTFNETWFRKWKLY